tara:strand:- start:91 stop:534 length:444 start_codon:yes stop_codon:yes gene_type:complete
MQELTGTILKLLDSFNVQCKSLQNSQFIGLMRDVDVLVATNKDPYKNLIIETYYVVKRQEQVVNPKQANKVKDRKKRKSIMLYCYKKIKKAVCVRDGVTQYQVASITQKRLASSQSALDRIDQIHQKSLDTFVNYFTDKFNPQSLDM